MLPNRSTVGWLLTVSLLALAPSTAAIAASGATLRVVQERPLVLIGARFKPHEAVRVTVRSGTRTLARTTRAGPRGGYRVEFRGVKIDFCAAPLSIVARGASSGNVRARLPRRLCTSP